MGLLAARAIESTELKCLAALSQESLSLRRLPCEVYFYLCPCQCAPIPCAAMFGILSPAHSASLVGTSYLFMVRTCTCTKRKKTTAWHGEAEILLHRRLRR